jgi:hypothetical protein
VIVLAGLRSGSTLLRFVLDSHPALVCPAETGVTALSAELAALGQQLTPTPSSPQGHDVLITGLVERLFGATLAASGKRRWCDKTLDSASTAGEFARLFPNAQFVCLYRHCLDVVDSALETWPWGPDEPALARFVRRQPGNLVAAFASYWLSSTTAILDFEKAHPARCVRLHYEEFVADPEPAAAALFAALGETSEPGITSRCFSDDHGARGRGDHKIWATRAVTTNSVGRGARVPIQRIPPATRRSINALCGELGYAGMDPPYWPLPVVRATPAAGTSAPHDALAEIDDVVESHLRHNLDRLRPVPKAWQALLGRRPIKLTVTAGEPSRWSHWLITVDPPNISRRVVEPESGAAWSVAAEADALLDVMRGRLNLAAAIRSRRIRLSRISADALGEGRQSPEPASELVTTRLALMVALFTDDRVEVATP